jgi:protein O-GlcNAc transferase
MSRSKRGPSALPRSRLAYTIIGAVAWILLGCATHGLALADSDGPGSLQAGTRFFEEERYEEAAAELWRAVLLHGETPPSRTYDVQAVFAMFLQCWIRRGMAVDGLAFVALESFRRGNVEYGRQFLQQALDLDPTHDTVRKIQEEYAPETLSALSDTEQDATFFLVKGIDVRNLTPEQLYELGASYFAEKDYEMCADLFSYSCIKSRHTLGPSCANAVYCRTTVLDWGFNGTQYDNDMQFLEELTNHEVKMFRVAPPSASDGAPPASFVWRRATSIHPHMTLAYVMGPSVLKRYITESVAFMDEQMARVQLNADDAVTGKMPSLPEGMPYSLSEYRESIVRKEALKNSDKRIRIGFVGSGFNSKAVLFLSHDMFRFFNHSEFDIHVFSLGPVDGHYFLQQVMRGTDWRQRVINNLETKEHFHDCQKFKSNHVELAQYIHQHEIHVLIEWDGFARQGERAQGLFGLRPAPVQILHQEYLGTSGASYVDYLITDKVASPPGVADLLYTEKLIYMPNHFFSKGHAMQNEVRVPSHEYQQRVSADYQLGKGTPAQNRCLSPKNVGPATPSFVYCNFNKFLKNNPETVRSWIRILREVPDSILCLLENPVAGVPYLRKFIHEAAGLNHTDGNGNVVFVPGDGDDLASRIHFLPWMGNPFDHQARNQDFCNAMLDSYPYNGHTVAQDALYGGVPIVTRSDGYEMASRVSTSANIVLGFNDSLNAYGGPPHYEEIAIALGRNKTFFDGIRNHLVDTARQRNPMHPYWDVPRYVRNFEEGVRQAWNIFLAGDHPRHIEVTETMEVSRGTYDDLILAFPPNGEGRQQK